MPKDPRFNFYVDNWTGGTGRMTFEQKGAYIDLLILNFHCLHDGLPGFLASEAASVLASAPALWQALQKKFKTEGEYFYNERLTKEFHKAKKHSAKQKEKADLRWGNEIPASAAADAFNGNGIGIESSYSNELIECKESLLKNPEWVMVACRRLNKTETDLPGIIDGFIDNLKGGLITRKTNSDFASHFINWAAKVKGTSANGLRSAAGFPDHWDPAIEKKLHGSELSAYWGHLRGLGLQPVRNRFKVVTDWRPAHGG